MAMAVSSNEGKSYCDINMTPLIDVMLVGDFLTQRLFQGKPVASVIC